MANFSQLFKNFFPVAPSVVTREACKGLGKDVMVMDGIHALLASDVEPQTMDQMYVFRFHGWRVGPDTESVY